MTTRLCIVPRLRMHAAVPPIHCLRFVLIQNNKLTFTWTVHEAAFTRCKLARVSQVPGMRAQKFHASRTMEVASRFKVKPVELFILAWNVCARNLRCDLTRASPLSWYKCGFILLAWNLCAGIPGTWVARVNLHRVSAAWETLCKVALFFKA
jgi:hypothetical protein